jgi:hypothetical protein
VSVDGMAGCCRARSRRVTTTAGTSSRQMVIAALGVSSAIGISTPSGAAAVLACLRPAPPAAASVTRP